MTRFDEIALGGSAEVVHTITERDLERFVDLTGDDNRLHVDKDYAKQTSFKERVVHGMLGASFISTVIGTKLPGDGALWFSQTLEFLLPVRVGDKIKVVATVIDKIERDSVIVLSTEIFNQEKQKVISGTAKVKIVEPVLDEVQQPQEEYTRTALIIGATGGVGAAVARNFAARGYDLILSYRSDDEKAERLRQELQPCNVKMKLVKGDASSESFVMELREQCRRFSSGLDYLVNTATAPVSAIGLDDLGWADFEKHLVANIKSSFYLAKTLSPLMAGQTAPGMVFVTSQASEVPINGWIPYITAKSALNGFAKALAMDLAPMGIRVNLVSPGMIDTDLIANIPKKARLLVEAKCPRRRLATPKDVAAAVAYLSSDDADYVTGETIRVNGGQVML